MLRRQRQIQTSLSQFVDAGLFALGFWLAHWLRSNAVVYFPNLSPIYDFSGYVWLWLFIIPVAPLLLKAQGFYNRPMLFSRRETAWVALKTGTMLAIGVISVLFIMREELARSVIILFGAIGSVMVVIKEELLLRWHGSEFGQAQMRRRVVLIGDADETEKMREDYRKRLGGALEVLAELRIDEASPQKLSELLHERSANGVILSTGHALFDQVERVIEICELEGVEVWLLADFFRTQISQTTVDDMMGRPMLVFRSAPEASWQGVAKQVIDVVGAAVAVIGLFPFLVLFGLLVKLTSKGPILFRQERSGLNGKPFTMLKFRTMVTNAEQRKAELESFNEMEGPVFKVSNDPRVTALGRWLRKYSIDELPQLWNVLRGEMSLVGPRPLPVDEIKRINDPGHRRRLSVKPGLTCLWQISGRNEVNSFKDWVTLDLEYIDNWSLWLDLKILLKTIPVVVLGTGAK
ncbi:MAG: exopolysaccharide biosynthesis polyprenyl glycosylphosphotransferase [Verrucomicrobiales bacterium]|nr:exopolysaccharide biosynthesis polyprenyl glycosylphosphotransferase [Verrucomicrobiales bacterium]|tara:strand:- start:1708 stop:3096 length:1389 start_codon:yes stop_codon:yes gene_type:complete